MNPGTTYSMEPIEQMSKPVEMQLMLGTTPESNWHAISELFELAGWSVSQNMVEADFRHAKTQAPVNQRFLLLHSHPVEAIAYAIANGTPPMQAMDTWLAAAEEMVDFYTKNHKQSAMAFIPYLLAEPEAQLTTIGSHLRVTDLPQPEISIKAEQAPLLDRLLASQLIQQNPNIETLLTRIEACTIPQHGHSYKAPLLDLDAANHQLATLKTDVEKNSRKLSAMSVQSTQLQKDNDLLLKQLHLVQDKLEAKYLSHDELSEQLDTLKQAYTESESATAKHRDQQENALVYANHQIQCLQTELNRVKSSKTFKASAMVSAVSDMFNSSPAKKALKNQALLVKRSGIFNEGWYLKTYPDVAEKGVDPIMHYLKFGAAELRNPSPEFDTSWYLTRHPDVAEENMNPVLHYFMFGQKEGRLTHSQEHQSSSVPALA